MKRMFTKLEIMALAMMALSPTVSGLEDSITEKGFSGEIPVSSGESGKFIDAGDIPEASGVYKLNDDGDILGVVQIDLDAAAWLAIVNGQMYQGAIVESADLNFYGDNLAGTKPIYCHPIHVSNSTAGQNNYHLTMLIFNNSPTPFTLSTFVSWLDSVLAQLPAGQEVQVLVSGAITNAEKTKTIISSYLYDNPTLMGIAGMTFDNTLDSIAAANAASLFGANCVFKDAVNRIN